MPGMPRLPSDVHNSSSTKNRSAHAVAAAALITCVFTAGAANAQESRRGAYIGLNVGLASSARLDSSITAVTTPTKCDRLLYASPALAPSGDPECMDATSRSLSSNGFSPGQGFTGGLSAGYAFDGLRIEVEYRARTHEGDVSPLLESTTKSGRGQQGARMEPGVPSDGVDLQLPRPPAVRKRVLRLHH